VPARASTLGGYALGAIPLGAGLVLGVLLLPQRATPEDVPVPVADGRVMAAREAEDRQLAQVDLSGEARALGSAVRAFHELEARQRSGDAYLRDEQLNLARAAIDAARAPLVAAHDDRSLRALRATQLEAFLAELRTFERSGKASSELVSLAGPFVERMRDVGWCTGSTLAMSESVARVMFETEWTSLVGVDRPELTPNLDEERLLYAFYIRHPHTPESVRKRIDAARAGATSARACHQLDEADALAAETWLLDKVKQLRIKDPIYAGDYAVGVVQFLRHDYPAAVASFRDWLDAHPSGPLTLRARSYLRASTYEMALLP
jgi:hypothetical protein